MAGALRSAGEAPSQRLRHFSGVLLIGGGKQGFPEGKPIAAGHPHEARAADPGILIAKVEHARARGLPHPYDWPKEMHAEWTDCRFAGAKSVWNDLLVDGPGVSLLLRSRSCFWESRVLAFRSERGPPPVGSSPDFAHRTSRAAQRVASPQRYLVLRRSGRIPTSGENCAVVGDQPPTPLTLRLPSNLAPATQILWFVRVRQLSFPKR